MKHEFEGGWVVLRDPKQVKEKHRRPIIAKGGEMQGAAVRVSEEGGSDERDLLALYEFNDLVAVALIEEWSFDLPITTESLGELPASAYDKVLALTAPLIAGMMPSFEPTPDPDSPTVPSGE